MDIESFDTLVCGVCCMVLQAARSLRNALLTLQQQSFRVSFNPIIHPVLIRLACTKVRYIFFSDENIFCPLNGKH